MDQEARQQLFTTMVKANSGTFFFDVKEAKNGKKYLVILQSRFNKDKERERAYMTIFNNDVVNFQNALADAVEHVVD